VTGPVLELAGVTKNYHGLRPLRLEQLTVHAGDRVALLGFDRPAAEIFVSLVTGAALPDAGSVTLFGRLSCDINDGAEWLATADRFGIVSDRAVLLEALSVVQNLALPFTLEIEPPPADVRRRAADLAAAVGLPASAWERPVGDLDAAGHARVRLGRALALDPAVLVLEHVSAGLDRTAARLLADDTRRVSISRGTALVALTADERFAATVASRVLTVDPATGRLRRR
jgi:predicted ABC-type transport system involved in lysophospholipase L1 biosynthesis ATPase subunit